MFRVSSKRSSYAKRQLRIESLEQRMLLAGDVRAYVHRGDLVIRGSDDDNAIYIAPGPTEDSVIVTPFDATTINGDQSQFPLQLNGITDDWRINLRGGSNHFTMWEPVTVAPFSPIPSEPAREALSFNIPDDLVIQFGDGDNNRLYMHSVHVGGDALFGARNGFFSMQMQQWYEEVENRIAGHLRVRVGDGGSQITLNGLDVGGDVVVTSGDGADAVQASGAVADDVTLRTAGGNDVVNLGLIGPVHLSLRPCVFDPNPNF
jgi:hypothetical protein